MILQENPSGAANEFAGNEFNLQANRSAAYRTTGEADAQARAAAAEQMRYQLYLLDRSQRRMSIEEVAAALLEAGGGIDA